MPTVLEEASSVDPPVTTAQEVREASVSPQDMRSSNQVCMVGHSKCEQDAPCLLFLDFTPLAIQ